jgi:ribosome-associated protein
MTTVNIKDEFIKLGQALKLAGVTMSGVEAKFMIQDGLVKVNGSVETQRGKKLYDGDKFEYDGKEFVIKAVN